MTTTIWIDLDNTPHVPFFKPVSRALQAEGFQVVMTARDAYQVCELAGKMGLPCLKIGRHYGKNKVRKALGVVWRSLQLLPFVRRNRPTLGLSHGSRSQILLCTLLGIPTVVIGDYEYGKEVPLVHPNLEIVPEALGGLPPRWKSTPVVTYPGIKEDVYVPEFEPDDLLPAQLGLDGNEVVVTVRPPATEAHYFREESGRLFEEFMDWIVLSPQARVVILPRSRVQETEIRREASRWFDSRRVIIPNQVVNGLNLMWHSDLVVSGGGTMNREAAALGVPVFSIFRGEIGAVDRQLVREGRLVLLENKDEFAKKIVLQRRPKLRGARAAARPPALEVLVSEIAEFAKHVAVRDE